MLNGRCQRVVEHALSGLQGVIEVLGVGIRHYVCCRFGGSMVVCHIVDLLYYSSSLSEALPAESDVERYRDG